MEKIPEKFLNKDGTLNSDALIKSYTELEKKIGTMVSVPDSVDDSDATKKFRRAIGVPETAAEYPHNDLFDDENIRQEFHKIGLTSGQVEKIYDIAQNFLSPVLSEIFSDAQEAKAVSAKYYLSEVYVETLRRHKARHESKGNGFGFEIRDWSDIAGAIVCGGMGRERNLVIDKRQKDLTPTTHIKGEINREGVRKMTPREWARLQGFPDDFVLPLADTHLYKQFGNSVTVNVIEAIAKEIKMVLDNA